MMGAGTNSVERGLGVPVLTATQNRTGYCTVLYRRTLDSMKTKHKIHHNAYHASCGNKEKMAQANR